MEDKIKYSIMNTTLVFDSKNEAIQYSEKNKLPRSSVLTIYSPELTKRMICRLNQHNQWRH